MLACGSGVSGCGETGTRERDVVARVSGEGQSLALERSVVASIAAREGITEAEAEARALATLRWVAARRVELAAREHPPASPDDLDPARRVQLERAALVRIWMDDVFEPNTAAANIPADIIEQNLATPSLMRRLFHPRLYFVCQALVVPAELDGEAKVPSEAEAAAQWRSAAEQAFAPFVARTNLLAPDLLASEDCSLLGSLVGGSQHSFETAAGELRLRFEQFAFAPAQAQDFDPEWVAAVTAVQEPAIVGPFATQFGLHLVIVSRIEPERLADGSLPPAQLQAERELVLRGEIETAYRADRMQQTLLELRERLVVRLAPELERER